MLGYSNFLPLVARVSAFRNIRSVSKFFGQPFVLFNSFTGDAVYRKQVLLYDQRC